MVTKTSIGDQNGSLQNWGDSRDGIGRGSALKEFRYLK